MKTKLSIILIILFKLTWMYLSESKSRWGGMNPLIGYYMNSEIVGFKSFQTKEERLEDIKKAAREWFLAGDSRISFKLEGFTNSKPLSYENIKCEGIRPDIPQGTAVFSFTQNKDTECADSSCVMYGVVTIQSFKQMLSLIIHFLIGHLLTVIETIRI